MRVERLPQLVVLVDRHVREEGLQRGEPLREDAVVDPLGDPLGRLLVEAAAEYRPVLVEEAHRAAQSRGEHRLVLAGVADRVDEPGDQRSDLDLAQPLVGEAGTALRSSSSRSTEAMPPTALLSSSATWRACDRVGEPLTDPLWHPRGCRRARR